MEKRTEHLKPNLFAHATRELSQDAILAWLLQWADPQYEAADKALHETGKFFIRKLYETAGRTVPPIDRLTVCTQKNKIDILAKLDCADGKKRIVLIEDKVFANENGDQLINYPEHVRGEVEHENDLLLIYLKTGYQHDWASIHTKNFAVFTARDLQAVWAYGRAQHIGNDIFNDFGVHLDGVLHAFEAAEKAFSGFNRLLAGEWADIWHWKGFLLHARQHLHEPGSRAVFGEQQNNREHLLYLGFALTPVTITGYGHLCEPGLNLTFANGNPNLEIRLWVEHLPTDLHTPLRYTLVQEIKKIPGFENAREGPRRKGRQSIRLLNLSLPDTWRTFNTRQFLDHLNALKTGFSRNVPRTVSI